MNEKLSASSNRADNYGNDIVWNSREVVHDAQRKASLKLKPEMANLRLYANTLTDTQKIRSLNIFVDYCL